MKKIIAITFISMSLLTNTCSFASGFFNGSPQEYAVKLHLTPDPDNAVDLSSKEVEILINILSQYKWKEDGSKKEKNWERHEISWGRYRFYPHHYYITITSPNKKSVTMRINGGGFNNDQFLIKKSDGSPYGLIMLERDKNSNLSKEDINKIKQLYFNNFSSFKNIEEATIKQPLHIVSNYSFNQLFNSLTVCDIALSQEDSKELIRLYNRGWDNNIAFFSGGIPSPMVDLYLENIGYGLPFNNMELIKENQQAFDNLKAKYMNGYDGEKTVKLKNYYGNGEDQIYFQYKDGKLHGKLNIYNKEGKLTYEMIYEKGVPVNYIRYGDKGKTVEAKLYPKDLMVEWKEYNENGEIIDSDRNGYQTTHDRDLVIGTFYKYNRAWRESPVQKEK